MSESNVKKLDLTGCKCRLAEVLSHVPQNHQPDCEVWRRHLKQRQMENRQIRPPRNPERGGI
jgi:hypothetical protein